MTTPINDNYQNAIILNSISGQISGNNTDATEQSDANEYTGHSVWFLWKAKVNGKVTFDTITSTFDTKLAAHLSVNSVPSLLISSNDDSQGGSQSTINFRVITGETYFIEVGGYDTENGDWVLNWSFSIPPVFNPDNVTTSFLVYQYSESVSTGGKATLNGTATFTSTDGIVPSDQRVGFEIVSGGGFINDLVFYDNDTSEASYHHVIGIGGAHVGQYVIIRIYSLAIPTASTTERFIVVASTVPPSEYSRLALVF